MQTCPRCNSSVDDGLLQCPSCATSLPATPAAERFVAVFHTGSVVEAETVRAVFEDRGLPCRQGQAPYSIVPDTNPITIEVASSRVAEAAALIAEIEQAPAPEIDEASGAFREIQANPSDVVQRGDVAPEGATAGTPRAAATPAARALDLARTVAGLYTLALGVVSLSSGWGLTGVPAVADAWVLLVAGGLLVAAGAAVAAGARWAVAAALVFYLGDVVLQLLPLGVASPLDLAGRTRTPLELALSVGAAVILAASIACLPKRR